MIDLEVYSQRPMQKEKDIYLGKWKKSIIYRGIRMLIFTTIPITLIYIAKHVHHQTVIDSLYVWFAALYFSFFAICGILENIYNIKGYMESKHSVWNQSLIFIERKAWGKLFGCYVKDGALYEGRIKAEYGEYARSIGICSYVTLIQVESSGKHILTKEIEWARIKQKSYIV